MNDAFVVSRGESRGELQRQVDGLPIRQRMRDVPLSRSQTSPIPPAPIADTAS